MNSSATPTRLPTWFISHGGGPWPWMQAETHGVYDRLAASLGSLLAAVGQERPQPRRSFPTPTPGLAGPGGYDGTGHARRNPAFAPEGDEETAGGRAFPDEPAAILMVSAHWEAPRFTVQGNPAPGMIYDYGGFPDYTYRIRYPSPGSPALARRVVALLEGAALEAGIDETRGYDHGMFSPMAVIRPDATLPVVQLSLRSGLDPAEHLALGRALQPLRDENVLIIGSGLSYHNLRAFGPRGREASHAFDAWLQDTVVARAGDERSARLCNWESAPAARLAHPREEHLLPLMVAVGAAETEPGTCVYHEADFMGALAVSSYRFG